MNLEDMFIKEDYANGVSSLTNGAISKDEVLSRLEDVYLDSITTEEDKSDVFCQCTERMISTAIAADGAVESDAFEAFSEHFKGGLVESLSQQVWSHSYDSYNPRKDNNPYWVENQITNVLVDVVGSDECVKLAFQQPKNFVNGMRQIPYGDSNLVDYLNQHIDKARDYGKPSKNLGNIANSSEVLNCVEAISDCNSQLSSLSNSIAGNKKR